MMTIGLHAACIDTAWAVLLATTQLFEAESRLKSESGQYLWESDGVSTASVEGMQFDSLSPQHSEVILDCKDMHQSCTVHAHA